MLGHIFLKELYDAEWPRRDQLGTAMGVPLAMLTVVASIIAFIFQRVDFRPPYWGVLAVCISGFATVCFARAVVLLVRSYHGHMYRRIPFPAEIAAYEDELYARHRAVGNADSYAEEAFDSFLRARYSDAADRNARINSQRGELLFQANRWMLWSFALAILAGVPSIVNVRQQPAAVYRVQLIKGDDDMADDKTQKTPAPAPKPIEPPTPPSNQDLRTEEKVPTTR